MNRCAHPEKHDMTRIVFTPNPSDCPSQRPLSATPLDSVLFQAPGSDPGPYSIAPFWFHFESN